MAVFSKRTIVFWLRIKLHANIKSLYITYLVTLFEGIEREKVFTEVSQVAQSATFRVTQGCQMNFFKPKNPKLLNIGGPWNGKCCYILSPYGIYYGHRVYFVYFW
jgi:hypothetical protein